jgi:hypothetical protein
LDDPLPPKAAGGHTSAILPGFLEDSHQVKQKEPRQTVCNEPKNDPKEPYCGGKLKKITALNPAAKKEAGEGNEVYRCQICKTLYVEPSPYAVKK